jgi:hypothetical protein
MGGKGTGAGFDAGTGLWAKQAVAGNKATRPARIMPPIFENGLIFFPLGDIIDLPALVPGPTIPTRVQIIGSVPAM